MHTPSHPAPLSHGDFLRSPHAGERGWGRGQTVSQLRETSIVRTLRSAFGIAEGPIRLETTPPARPRPHQNRQTPALARLSSHKRPETRTSARLWPFNSRKATAGTATHCAMQYLFDPDHLLCAFRPAKQRNALSCSHRSWSVCQRQEPPVPAAGSAIAPVQYSRRILSTVSLTDLTHEHQLPNRTHREPHL